MSSKTGTATGLADLIGTLHDFLTTIGHASGKTFVGVGDGDLINYQGKSATVAETLTLTASSSTSFAVVGSVSGSLGTATVGTTFTSSVVDFKITAGGTAYVSGDIWRLTLSPKWPENRPIQGAYLADRSASNTWDNPAALLDGNITSYANAGFLPSTVQFKLQAAVEVREIGIWMGGNAPNGAPSAFTIDYSDDGSTWTTAQSYTGQSSGWPSAFNERRFSVTASGAHAYWRLSMSAINAGSQLSISNVNLYDAISSQSALNFYPWFSVQVPGNDGAQPSAHISIVTNDNVPGDIFGMRAFPHTAYSGTSPIDGQTGGGALVAAGMACSNSSMPYWIVASGRRFVMVVKVSTTYHVLYGGLLLAYARPSQYPIPLAVGGSSGDPFSVRWSDTSATTRHFWTPAHSNQLLVRDFNGTWRTFINTDGNPTFPSAQSGPANRVFPSWINDSSIQDNASRSESQGQLHTIRENFGGSYPLIPMVALASSYGPFGEFEGCFWTSGFGNSAENVIRQDRIDHVVFQNCGRTAAGDYFALRMD
jgi:F5/8 type C domain-containing protein